MVVSTKKIIFIIFSLVLVIGSVVVSKFFFSDTKNLNSIYLIPRDAVYFVSSKTPIKNWKKVRDSKVWQHLQTNTYFAELTSNATTFDSILNENKKLFDLLGSKRVLVSIHPISKYKYDYLFIVDLEKTAKLLQFNTLIKSILPASYILRERNYHGVEILELFDKKTRETLSLAIINNNLISSYTHSLVEAAIDQLNEPTIGRDLKFIEINQKTSDNGLLQLFVQYNYLDDFVYILSKYSDNWLKDLSKTLVYSGFDVDLKSGVKLVAKGFTNTNDNSISYIQALQNSGIGNHSIAKVAPYRTSMYFSLSFDSFGKFYDNYLQIQEDDPKTFELLKSNERKIEKSLDISIQKNFVSWVDDEVALLKLEPIQEVTHDNFALVFKANDIEKASKNLTYILKQIKKKTPVKFKEISYKGYPIKFMSIKGFFKVFLGGYFKKLETPYFTLIDDYVIFSNHPNTLKYIITHFEENHTLQNAANYKYFNSNFEDKSNLFVYINIPMIYDAMLAKVGKTTQNDLLKNKQYFTSFSQIGIQLMPKDNMFKSTVIIQYKDQESIQYSDEFNPPTVNLDQGEILEKDIKPIVVETVDPMRTLVVNPDDLNKDLYKKYYSNGKLRMSIPLKDGHKNGMYREYYKNGELRLKGRFKSDKKTGIWRKYDIYGKLLLKKKY